MVLQTHNDREVNETYIPERFKHTFMGFPRKWPYEKIEEAHRKQHREEILRHRKAYRHKSRGWLDFKKEIEDEILKAVDSDWRYNGDDEYQYDTFDTKVAAKKVFNLIRKKGLLKYIV